MHRGHFQEWYEKKTSYHVAAQALDLQHQLLFGAEPLTTSTGSSATSSSSSSSSAGSSSSGASSASSSASSASSSSSFSVVVPATSTQVQPTLIDDDMPSLEEDCDSSSVVLDQEKTVADDVKLATHGSNTGVTSSHMNSQSDDMANTAPNPIVSKTTEISPRINPLAAHVQEPSIHISKLGTNEYRPPNRLMTCDLVICRVFRTGPKCAKRKYPQSQRDVQCRNGRVDFRCWSTAVAVGRFKNSPSGPLWSFKRRAIAPTMAQFAEETRSNAATATASATATAASATAASATALSATAASATTTAASASSPTAASAATKCAVAKSRYQKKTFGNCRLSQQSCAATTTSAQHHRSARHQRRSVFQM